MEKWTEFITGVKDAVGSVELTIIPSMDYEIFAANVSSKIPKSFSLQLTPASIDITDWNTYVDSIAASLKAVDLNVVASISSESIEDVLAELPRTYLLNVLPAAVDLEAWNNFVTEVEKSVKPVNLKVVAPTTPVDAKQITSQMVVELS